MPCSVIQRSEPSTMSCHWSAPLKRFEGVTGLGLSLQSLGSAGYVKGSGSLSGWLSVERVGFHRLLCPSFPLFGKKRLGL